MTLLALITFSVMHAQPIVLKEVLLDNEEVLVVRLTYPVGSESGMHQHRYQWRTVYVLEGGHLTFITADNPEQRNTVTVKAGAVMYVPASEHNVINSGQTPVVLVETEIKQAD